MFSIPLFSAVIYQILEENKIKLSPWILTVLLVSIIPNQFFGFISTAFGFNLEKNINSSAEFFKNTKISGPIFNNYDIGGYLIYHLYVLLIAPGNPLQKIA